MWRGEEEGDSRCGEVKKRVIVDEVSPTEAVWSILTLLIVTPYSVKREPFCFQEGRTIAIG